MSGSILLQCEDGIATVVLNRPDKLNAMTIEMYRRFGEVFNELNANDSVRCVVLRGAGERAFCPGSDIGEFDSARADRAKAKEYAALTLPPTLKLWNFRDRNDVRYPDLRPVEPVRDSHQPARAYGRLRRAQDPDRYRRAPKRP